VFLSVEDKEKEVLVLLTKKKQILTAVISDHLFAQEDQADSKHWEVLQKDCVEKLVLLDPRQRVLTDRSSYML